MLGLLIFAKKICKPPENKKTRNLRGLLLLNNYIELYWITGRRNRRSRVKVKVPVLEAQFFPLFLRGRGNNYAYSVFSRRRARLELSCYNYLVRPLRAESRPSGR